MLAHRVIGIAWLVFLQTTSATPTCGNSSFSGQCYHNHNQITTKLTGVTSPEDCCELCSDQSGCATWTWWIPQNQTTHACRLFGSVGALLPCPQDDGTSGDMTPVPPAPSPSPPPPPAPPGAMNVLFIAVDDLRAQLGVYNHTDTHTPNLDAFAQTALLFENAHAQIAHCSPSRNSLMSGRTPDSIKVWNFIDDFRDPTVGGPDIVALPQYFKQKGWWTWGAGKVFHPGKPAANDQTYSWTDPYVEASGGSCATFDNGHPSNYACFSNNATADSQVATAAVEKLQQLVSRNITAANGRPFLVAAGVHKPHLPYFYLPEFENMYPPVEETAIPPPQALTIPVGMPPIAWMACMGINGEEPNFIDFNNLNLTQTQVAPTSLVRNITRGYMASVSYVDQQVGRMLTMLDTLGLQKDTVVVVWGDHGQNLGEHNTYCKMTLFESATRVPLLIRDPSSSKTSWGARTDSPAQLLDMYPTVAVLAGAGLPSSVDGVDLSPLFTDPNNQGVSIAAFSQQARCYVKNAATPFPTPQQKTFLNMMTCEFVPRTQMDFMGYSLRTRDYRFTMWVHWNGTAMTPNWNASVGSELYDHRPTSPDGHLHPEWRENNNLIADPDSAPIVQQLRARLIAHFTAK
eukprot:m.106342 g.106342  ORF g.106342 m.106342 type:complete len:629 (-) comp12693_c0_seq3:73-1959(-)